MATTVSSQSIRKRAIVIGNGMYATGNNLPNALNDAIDIAAALKEIDFIIDEPKLNLTYEEMDIALTRFKHSLKNGDLALFYFAGHGVQWEVYAYDTRFLSIK